MGVETKIEWAHHTWSPWHGCRKVSDGCKNCYAEAQSKRNPKILGVWGPNGTRVISKSWDKPLAFDRAAARAGERRRNFPSVCDWLEDRRELDMPRARLLNLIRQTRNLDHLLLTKRPENWRPLLERVARETGDVTSEVVGGIEVAQQWLDGNPPPNVWLGVSVENQKTANARVPALLEIPAALRWVSYEPALGPVEFNPLWLDPFCDGEEDPRQPGPALPSISWVVVGGESGRDARRFDVRWARDTIRQCDDAGVPVFVKQLGRHPFDGLWTMRGFDYPTEPKYLHIRHKKGGDPLEWPEDLRVREMPSPTD